MSAGTQTQILFPVSLVCKLAMCSTAKTNMKVDEVTEGDFYRYHILIWVKVNNWRNPAERGRAAAEILWDDMVNSDWRELLTEYSGCIEKKRNNHDGQLSQLRLQWTFPQKTASLPVGERVRQCPLLTDADYVIESIKG